MKNDHHCSDYSGETYLVNKAELIRYLEELKQSNDGIIKLEDVRLDFELRFSTR